ncbi:hypothetical protein V2J09_016907 [Rumex salicifolius]
MDRYSCQGDSLRWKSKWGKIWCLNTKSKQEILPDTNGPKGVSVGKSKANGRAPESDIKEMETQLYGVYVALTAGMTMIRPLAFGPIGRKLGGV